MTRLEAIEKTAAEISSLEKFLNQLDSKHPVNIVDPGFMEEPLANLVNACDEAMVWLKKEAEKEEDDSAMTHEEKKQELCIKDSDF